MVTVRKSQAGFTLTETMVVVLILSILAALSTPLLVRDNTARRGRDFAKIVAQTLQRARFQAMGDRTNVHVLLYRTRVDTYRQNLTTPSSPAVTYDLLSSIQGPVADDAKTVAIWATKTANDPPTDKTGILTNPTHEPDFSSSIANDITFTPLGATLNNTSWWIYLRNELLESNHPDASFVISVSGLTGHVSSNDKVVLP
jgi:prepilin-type N-terminal cleavage/methylation domain-containing protein